MRQFALAAAVMSAATAGAAPGLPDEGRPPPRWWQYAEGLFQERFRTLTLSVALDEQRLQSAEARLAHFRDQAAAVMRARQAEINVLAADYLEYRSKLAEGQAPDPAAEERIEAVNRRLFDPIAALLAEFASEMQAVHREAAREAAAAAQPDANSDAVSESRPPAAEWADETQVAALLGNLAEPTDSARLEQELALHVGGREPTARQQALLEHYRAKLDAARSDGAAEWARLADAVAIVRRHPSAVRTADVSAMRDHWNDLIAGWDAVVAEFRAELRKSP